MSALPYHHGTASAALPRNTLPSQAGRCNQRLIQFHCAVHVRNVRSSTFGGTSEAPSRPPSPLNMLRMEEGPEEGGLLAAGSVPGAPGPCCAAGACLPGAYIAKGNRWRMLELPSPYRTEHLKSASSVSGMGEIEK